MMMKVTFIGPICLALGLAVSAAGARGPGDDEKEAGSRPKAESSDRGRGMIVRGAQGLVGVSVGGGGVGVAGVSGPDGFEGAVLHPDGSVERLPRGNDGRAASGKASIKVIPQGGRHDGIGVFVGQGKPPVIGTFDPATFDPFAFAFGPSRSPFAPGEFPPPPPAIEPSRPAGAIRSAIDPLSAARRDLRSGRYREALRQLERVDRDANDADIEQARALALFALGRHDEAVDAVRDALDAGTPWSWSDVRMNYRDDATYLQHFQKLRDRATAAPDNASLQVLLGYHALLLEQPTLARSALQRALDRDRDDETAQRLLDSIPPAPPIPGAENPAKPNAR